MKQKLVKALIDSKALLFGDFTLKDGSKSPIFFNSGEIKKGEHIRIVGEALAEEAEKLGSDYDTLFGAAYKGIPLVTATAIAANKPFFFDRKEAKDHGEGGNFIGLDKEAKKVVIVDDVITSGLTKLEAIGQIRKAGLEVVGIVIVFDREDKREGKKASQLVQERLGIPFRSCITLSEFANEIKKMELLSQEQLKTLFDYIENR